MPPATGGVSYAVCPGLEPGPAALRFPRFFTAQDTEQDNMQVAWAEEKADWFDPAIASEDPILGVRKHTESNNQKELKTLYSTWQSGYKHI